MDCGVGVAARGYSLGSRLCRWPGAFITKGGNFVVVVVVVVTTVVCVAGAKESCPSVLYAGTSCTDLEGRAKSVAFSGG